MYVGGGGVIVKMILLGPGKSFVCPGGSDSSAVAAGAAGAMTSSTIQTKPIDPSIFLIALVCLCFVIQPTVPINVFQSRLSFSVVRYVGLALIPHQTDSDTDIDTDTDTDTVG